ncbi:MAG: DUF1704 domain-containing protein [Patescibacteria group bacterium]|nr:DUF1704 domain-containing protein [Patescibacteria group bacterium]
MNLPSTRHILGANSNFLDFVYPVRSQQDFSWIKNRSKIKAWLQARGIFMPKTLLIVKNISDLDRLNFDILPQKFIIRKVFNNGRDDNILTLSSIGANAWLDSRKRLWKPEDIKQHILDILDGGFSKSGLPDIACIEQRPELDKFFARLGQDGLPVIKIIVYRNVPLMAMLKLAPPAIVNNKFGLRQNEILIGIDIATGETTNLFTNSVFDHKKEILTLPWSGRVVRGLEIPMWQDILLLASQVQSLINANYLTVEISLDAKNGPVVCGLSIDSDLDVQLANHSSLRERLDKVKGLKISTLAQGVSISRDLFGEKKTIQPTYSSNALNGRKIIGTLEIVKIFHADRRRYHQLPAKITPTRQETILDLELARILGLADENDEVGARKKIKIEIGGIRMTLAVILRDLTSIGKEYRFNLGSHDLYGFLIDPVGKNELATDILEKKKIAEEEFQKGVMRLHYKRIDAELSGIDKQLKIFHYLRPINLSEERQKFFADPEEAYNPCFSYAKLNFNPEHLKERLNKIETDDTPLGEIFERKRQELLDRINLLEQIGNDPARFTESSKKLYGAPDSDLILFAKAELSKIPDALKKKQIQKHTSESLVQEFNKLFLRHGLSWRAELCDDLSGSVALTEKSELFVKSDMRFTKAKVDALVAHEIETHIFILENSKRQPYRIFQNGTADHLFTQEGLAAFNQQYSGGDFDKVAYWANCTLATALAMKYSFAETYHYVRQMGFGKREAWAMVMRLKSGLSDTSQLGALTRDIVYLRGRRMIEQFILNGGDLRSLYIGKIGISDLPLLEKVTGLQKPYYLPHPIPDAKMLEEAIDLGCTLEQAMRKGGE